MFDATFWALIGLVIFLGIVVYFKVPGMITAALDTRADKIKNELEEARRLREEAQEMLAEYERKRKEAEDEAQSIVEAARREADMLAQDAKKKTEEFVTRRNQIAEEKIARAEAEAVMEVRNSAVDVAIAAATSLLGEKMTAKTSGDLFKDSLAKVKANMN